MRSSREKYPTRLRFGGAIASGIAFGVSVGLLIGVVLGRKYGPSDATRRKLAELFDRIRDTADRIEPLVSLNRHASNR